MTITWSENVDQTLAVPGAASRSPRTAAQVSPDCLGRVVPGSANQTRFTLSGTVHRLDTLALTYTKPGSDPMVRDTALATGNAAATATLNNASITNNTTNVPPSTPALVSPADAARLNSATPTLTAKFLDADTQDNGKVTFEVCSTSNCSTSLGTFDSTSTNLAVNANGSATVPGGFNLANATTYYWRAKNVDSSAASSSFSAIQSFLVDTTAPTMSSATVAADGTTVTITWSENLDQTQAVPGNAFSITPNGGRRLPAPQPRSAIRPPTRPGSRCSAHSTTSTRSHSPTRSRAATRCPRHRARHGQPGHDRHLADAVDRQQHLQFEPYDAGSGQPLGCSASQHRHPDADRHVCRSRLPGHRQGHIRGLLDEQLLELARHLRLDQHQPRRQRQRLRRRPGRLQPRKRDDLLLARQERRLLRSELLLQRDPVLPRRHRFADHELRDRRSRRRHGDHHLVGEPRPDTGRPGSAFSIAPNGGAGIAGTASSSDYPAANQTRFTLSSVVHHLDSLALTYTKPGSNPMVRDTALGTGNAAATACSPTRRSRTTRPTRHRRPRPLVSPADTARLSTTTPTLTANFLDPDSQDTGKVTFEVCSTNNCSSSLGTFDSTSTTLAVNANGSAAVPAGFKLASGTTYYWRAENVDSSAALLIHVDPVVPRRHRGADDELRSGRRRRRHRHGHLVGKPRPDPGRPRLVLRIAPNGGAGIAGTAAAANYPAANQTQFILSSAVHHLDSLALTYTKPGGDPMVRDTALATGNAAATATLTNASMTNNTTNASPSTPALVGPADAIRLNTTTPTLTATFGDPDTQDTGKVTFEVCTTSNCSSSLGTFDSTAPTSLSVRTAVRGPSRLQPRNGTTYYWRAENVDSSAAGSSFSATRLLPRRHDRTDHELRRRRGRRHDCHGHLVGDARPDASVPGTAFSIAPNGGAGIAGTAAAVSYPAANQTRFTLSSTVHHLDTLALSYTKPGSDPMVRDTALATGNPAATASGSAVTNNTANLSPDTSTLVTPNDGHASTRRLRRSRPRSATPTRTTPAW